MQKLKRKMKIPMLDKYFIIYNAAGLQALADLAAAEAAAAAASPQAGVPAPAAASAAPPAAAQPSCPEGKKWSASQQKCVSAGSGGYTTMLG